MRAVSTAATSQSSLLQQLYTWVFLKDSIHQDRDEHLQGKALFTSATKQTVTLRNIIME